MKKFKVDWQMEGSLYLAAENKDKAEEILYKMDPKGLIDTSLSLRVQSIREIGTVARRATPVGE